MENDDVIYFRLNEDSMNLLRFYNDGNVIGVTIGGSKFSDIETVLKWFKIENFDHTRSKGIYEFDGKLISFTLKSTSGNVIYNGSIDDEGLINLIVKSEINGNVFEKKYKKYKEGLIKTNSISFLSKKNKISEQLVFEKNTNPKVEISKLNDSGLMLKNYLVIGFIALILLTCISRKRTGAKCWDGTNSGAHSSGACSHHGGVKYWKYKYWWE